MCIEPVMATVICTAFGTVVHDWRLIKMGIRNNCLVIFMCLLVGFFYALIAICWQSSWGIFPTGEMAARGQYKALWYGTLQAFNAGAAVALALLGDNKCGIVGVAICSTFLPPITNTGVLWAYVCHLSWRGFNEQWQTYNISGEMWVMKPSFLPETGYDWTWYPDMRWEAMYLSWISAVYTYINCVFLYLACVLLLKLKEVAPLGKMDKTARFFQQDIPEYRRQRGSTIVGTNYDTIGQNILEEWARLTGVDPKVLMSNSAEARVTQLQTLRDLADDVENDDVYHSVTKGAFGKPDVSYDHFFA